MKTAYNPALYRTHRSHGDYHRPMTKEEVKQLNDFGNGAVVLSISIWIFFAYFRFKRYLKDVKKYKEELSKYIKKDVWYYLSEPRKPNLINYIFNFDDFWFCFYTCFLSFIYGWILFCVLAYFIGSLL